MTCKLEIHSDAFHASNNLPAATYVVRIVFYHQAQSHCRNAMMATRHLRRVSLWRHLTTTSRSTQHSLQYSFQSSLQPVRQKRLATYRSFPGRGPSHTEYKSRYPGINRLHYAWDTYRLHFVIVLSGGGSLYVYNLEAVPITGRRRFNIVSAKTERDFVKGAYSMQLESCRGKILPPEHPYTVMVANIVQRLLRPVEGLAEDDWEVHVIDDPKQKNAFVMAGGKVFVFTGLLPICQDEDALAVVLGHEIAHVVAHHTAEKLSEMLILLPLIYAASVVLDISQETVSSLASLIISLPNNRTKETEADNIGLLMMAQSCYNPEAAIPFWQRMSQANKNAPLQLLSIHPSDQSRIEALTALLPQAQDRYHTSECGLTSSHAREFTEAFGSKGVAGRNHPVMLQQPPHSPEKEEDTW